MDEGCVSCNCHNSHVCLTVEITDREAAAAGDAHREGEGLSWMVAGIGRD